MASPQPPVYRASWIYRLTFTLSVAAFAAALVGGAVHHLVTVGSPPGIRLEHLAEGDRFTAMEDYSRAAQVYQRAAAVAPDDDQALMRLGHAARQLGNAGEAAEAFARVVRLNPGHAGAHLLLALMSIETGDAGRAARHAGAAARLRPDSAEAHAVLGSALLQLGRREEAARRFRHALRLDPGLDPARRGLIDLGEDPAR